MAYVLSVLNIKGTTSSFFIFRSKFCPSLIHKPDADQLGFWQEKVLKSFFSEEHIYREEGKVWAPSMDIEIPNGQQYWEVLITPGF